MANIESLDIIQLRPDHVDSALALSTEAGWNQTADDWNLMITRGHAIGIQGEGERLVATALAFPYVGDIAWISMVLVTPEFQRQGIAARLVAECVRWLNQRDVTAVLDATPQGAEVYRRSGFNTIRRLTRWQRRLPHVDPPRQIYTIADANIDDLAMLDRRTAGGDRRFMLTDLMRRDGCVAVGATNGRGFALSRRGRVATQVGPITAETPKLAMDLLDAALARVGAPVFIDAFDDQESFGARLRQLGFVVQRTFERMARGARREIGDSSTSFAAAGPELG